MKKNQKIPKLTMRHLAEIAGCSLCTVSRALADNHNVEEFTRKRIQRLAQEYGYRRKTARQILLIIPGFGLCPSVYDSSLLYSFCNLLRKKGFLFEIIHQKDIFQVEHKLFDGAISLGYDRGFVRAWGDTSTTPFVSVNDYGYHAERIFSVYSNDEKVFADIIGYLKNRGHRELAFFESESYDTRSHQQRKKYFSRFAKEAGLSGTFYSMSMPDTEVARCLNKKVTAIIYPYEMVELSLYSALIRHGKKIPDDMELIHWNVPGISNVLMPLQRRYEQDYPLLAAKALELLETAMDGYQKKLDDVAVDYKVLP